MKLPFDKNRITLGLSTAAPHHHLLLVYSQSVAPLSQARGIAVASGTAISRKVAGSIPYEVTAFFDRRNPSSRIMASNRKECQNPVPGDMTGPPFSWDLAFQVGLVSKENRQNKVTSPVEVAPQSDCTANSVLSSERALHLKN
jgi:hypothetical protein